MSPRTMRLRALVPVVALLAVPVFAVPANAAPTPLPKASDSLRTRPSGRLQVRFKATASESARAAALAKVAAKVERRIDRLDAVVLSAGDQRSAQRRLANDPSVLYVEPESRYRPFAEEPAPEHAELGADVVQQPPTSNTGAGQVIAVVDSPVSLTNTDLNDAGKVTSAGDFTDDFPGTQDFACDDVQCPHGTAVATAAAAENDGTGMVGVAPGANIRSYSVFRRWVVSGKTEVLADSGSIAAALAAVAEYGETHTELVAVNMSFGGPFDNRLVREAIELVHVSAPQVTVVVAAGNDGGERANFPAGDPLVLSVGATGQVPDGLPCDTAVPGGTPWTVAAFSNRGDVDVVAPGRCVNVWYPTVNATTGAVNAGTAAVRKENGTSFAAPMVAGVVAMLGSAGVKGDAARAAVISSATGTSDVTTGAGKANAPAALALATGTAPYVSLSVDRGGQVASNVGRRVVEVLRIVPGAATAPAPPAVTVTSGFGSLTSGVETAAAGYYRKVLTYAVPATAKPAGTTFGITATGSAGGDDVFTVPMRMLDSTDSFEGVPAASNESGTAALHYGTRSAYVRSVAVPSTGGTIEWDYTFGEGGWVSGDEHPAELLIWEPPSDGGTADAAMEPTFSSVAPPDTRSYNDFLNVGGAEPHYCEFLGGDENDVANYRKCRTGRYLIGFVAYDSDADSSGTAKYALKLRYGFGPTVSANAPALASSVSTSGSFGVSWSGSRAVKWDVSYAVMGKSGTTYTLGAYQPWKPQTTEKYGLFGAQAKPVKVAIGQTYHLRFVAYDALGNPTLPITKATVVPSDDRASVIGYSSSWTNVSVSGYYLGTVKKSMIGGARASVATDAGAFSIVGARCSVCGQFRVYVDGVYKKTIDTYKSGSTAVRQVLWTSGALPGGIKGHRLTIIVSGTKGRPKVLVDAIGVSR